MKNIMEMCPKATSILDPDFAEFRELLYLLANDQIFRARDRLFVLLNEPSAAAKNRNWRQSSGNFTAAMKASLFFWRLTRRIHLKA